MTAPQVIRIGWRNSSNQAAFAFPAPVLRDPQTVAIPAAFSARLRCAPQAPQGCVLVSEGDGGLREAAFRGLVSPFQPGARRREDTPVVQIALNLFFVTDEPCALMLLPPYAEPGWRDWPGSMVCGRFPLRDWPRPVNCALEWDEPERDWIIRRGEPLAYVRFAFDSPNKRPRLVRAESTPALERHRRGIDGVAAVGRGVGPMFQEAARRRPTKLLTVSEES